ncbi:Chromodomain-helicase-DNA-binding protein 8 [Aix galericulata]|nr:Chromodomain-helicase-DNA-binding protein 8 [Aix galericulata]
MSPNSQRCPQAPEDVPKNVPKTPKTSQRPQGCPQTPNDVPKSPNDVPKSVPKTPKMSPKTPTMFPRVSPRPQRHLKDPKDVPKPPMMSPNPPKMSPRVSQRRQGCPQECPQDPKDVPKPPRVSPSPPRCTPGGGSRWHLGGLRGFWGGSQDIWGAGGSRLSPFVPNPSVDFDKDCEDPEYKPLAGTAKEVDEEGDPLMLLDEEIAVVDGDEAGPPGQPPAWPAGSVLTARLRRLVAACQRSCQRQRLRAEAAARGERRRRRCEAACKLKEMARRQKQQRWTRREQADFYRVVSTFGVEFDPETRRFRWGRFRALARLERKTDESLAKFFHGFVAMCRQVCRLPPAPGDEPPDPSVPVTPVSAERASRSLRRLALLRRLREQVLRHPLLPARLALCPQPGPDLPAWWQRGHHDGELLRGAARHGLARPEAAIIGDPDFSFLASRCRFLRAQGGGGPQGTPPGPAGTPQAAAAAEEDEDSELELGKVSASASESSSGEEDSDEERGEEGVVFIGGGVSGHPWSFSGVSPLGGTPNFV